MIPFLPFVPKCLQIDKCILYAYKRLVAAADGDPVVIKECKKEVKHLVLHALVDLIHARVSSMTVYAQNLGVFFHVFLDL